MRYALLVTALSIIMCFPLLGQGQAVPLSGQAEISVLTVAQGDPLWAAFGHCGMRVHDPITGIDRAYDYGVFDFTKPTFYSDFTKGLLLYKLVAGPYRRFVRKYELEGRWIKEQILNLDSADTQGLFNYLENNALPQNCEYEYHYFYDNCATRLIDIVQAQLGDRMVQNHDHLEEGITIRDLVNQYNFEHPWGDFGIDLVLGSNIDKVATPRHIAFLPDFTNLVFANSQLKTAAGMTPLIKEERVALDFPQKDPNYSQPFTPTRVMWLLFILAILLSARQHKWTRLATTFDFILFFLIGIAGLLMALLWFGTGHVDTGNNWNLLWAWPTHLLILPFLFKKSWQRKIRRYFGVSAIFTVLIVLLWWAWPQDMPNAAIPLVLAGAIRSARLGFAN